MPNRIYSLLATVTSAALIAIPAEADSPQFKADPPASILTPDEMNTSVGTLKFPDGAELMLDIRSTFFYYATGITPAMAAAKPGTGSAYAAAFRDKDGNYFDGGKTYKITLPGPIPANNFWTFTVYDNQSRSLLETGQKLAGVDSLSKDIKLNEDGSATVWFGPTAPAGQEGNWVQTIPGKGWNTLLRLYGPLEPWFDKSWKPGDFEELK